MPRLNSQSRATVFSLAILTGSKSETMLMASGDTNVGIRKTAKQHWRKKEARYDEEDRNKHNRRSRRHIVLAPSPDPFTVLFNCAAAAFLCAVPLLILARFEFLKSASRPVHTLVCVLVCLAVILPVECFSLASVIAHRTP